MALTVKNMQSPNGNFVANQFIITDSDPKNNTCVITFQSYETTIAQNINGQIVLDVNALEYSNTTLKYLKLFLGTNKSKKELYQDIENGKFSVADLNP